MESHGQLSPVPQPKDGSPPTTRSDRVLPALDLIAVGDVMMDVVLKSDRTIVSALEFEGTNYFSSSRVVPGGAGNVASALAHLGGKAALIGKAGRDVYGKAYVEDLESRGILAKVELDSSMTTGFAVSLVEPGGHRTMLVSRGANDTLRPQEVRHSLRKLAPSKFVYVSGYSLFDSPQREAILEAARVGMDSGSEVVFDPGSSNLAKDHPEVFEKATDSCNILCANLAESRALAKGLEPSEYARLLSRRGKRVVVKMGPQGCLVSLGGECSTIPGLGARSVDTTGAGDAFLGALLYGLSQDCDMRRAASFANWFAARKIEGFGPRHFPEKQEALKVLTSFRQGNLLLKEQLEI